MPHEGAIRVGESEGQGTPWPLRGVLVIAGAGAALAGALLLASPAAADDGGLLGGVTSTVTEVAEEATDAVDAVEQGTADFLEGAEKEAAGEGETVQDREPATQASGPAEITPAEDTSSESTEATPASESAAHSVPEIASEAPHATDGVVESTVEVTATTEPTPEAESKSADPGNSATAGEPDDAEKDPATTADAADSENHPVSPITLSGVSDHVLDNVVAPVTSRVAPAEVNTLLEETVRPVARSLVTPVSDAASPVTDAIQELTAPVTGPAGSALNPILRDVVEPALPAGALPPLPVDLHPATPTRPPPSNEAHPARPGAPELDKHTAEATGGHSAKATEITAYTGHRSDARIAEGAQLDGLVAHWVADEQPAHSSTTPVPSPPELAAPSAPNIKPGTSTSSLFSTTGSSTAATAPGGGPSDNALAVSPHLPGSNLITLNSTPYALSFLEVLLEVAVAPD